MVITGIFSGSIDFGGGIFISSDNNDIFVAALASNGNHVWSYSYGGSSTQEAQDVVVDAAGDVALSGQFYGSLTLGGSTFSSARYYDAFLAKLDASGNHLWSRQVSGLGEQVGAAVAVDSAGALGFGGIFQNTIDLGSGALTTQSWAGFLAKYEP